MVLQCVLEAHPYAADVLEWLHERRRFSNIRHPFRKFEFEDRILNEVCASLGSATPVSGNFPFPETDKLLSNPEQLLVYVRSLLRSHSGSGHVDVSLKKAWLTSEDKGRFKDKMDALLTEFEKSTSKLGEPMSILSIQTDG